ncbi:hypothetical protein FSP39_021970 [Pinctada imbricata]|uniref:Coiled-coil domain-containing protein 81 n=1 Tax=Pinctada imbricata TaxID=66713 RepID=A0AA89C7Y9_PINIB|nr:hypothetical protein FSP39_021970 [Pinctada imbricata]
MTEAMQGILAEAKKNRYSLIKDTLSEDDVANVWESVSNFIEKQMSQGKGVGIPALGTFTFTQKKLDIGNNKFIMMQRPLFVLSEKFAQTHGLQYTKYHVPGTIPVVQLNFAAMAFESPFDRDTVESCVKEILSAVSRAVGAKKNVELTFNGIGRLTIRDSRVKMRFYKEYINQMDGSGKLLDSMQNRPGTVDSVMSDRVMSRPASSATVVLPKISNTSLAPGGGGLAPVVEEGDIDNQIPDPLAPVNQLQEMQPMDTYDNDIMEPPPPAPVEDIVQNEGMVGMEVCDLATSEAIRHIEDRGEGLPNTISEKALQTINVPITGELDINPDQDDLKKPPSVVPSRSGSRMAMPLAKANGVSLLDDLVPSVLTPKSAPSPGLGTLHKSAPSPFNNATEGAQPRMSGSPKLAPLQRSHSMTEMPEKEEKPATPPKSACGHPVAGQELCYLCHQRARRNIPVSFTEERKRREDEEDKLLQQFQYMKDAEDTLAQQERDLSKRHDLQKMAAFNLGVAEAVTTKKKSRDTEFHKSYIFQRRPLTPNRIYKQQEYSGDLAVQVNAKEEVKKKRKSDEDFLERLEQVQLAEDLAAQREQYLKDKQDQQDMYKQALEAQIHIRDKFRKPDGLLRTPSPPSLFHSQQFVAAKPKLSTSRLSFNSFSLPMIPNVIRPFGESSRDRLNEDLRRYSATRLRFKPLQVPPREPDNEVFGKNDMTNEKMAARRSQAFDLFREQQDLVAQKKREAILKRLTEQKEEEDVLDRTKKELLDDRAGRYNRRMNMRKRLENDWMSAAQLKRQRDMEERLHLLQPALLLT